MESTRTYRDASRAHINGPAVTIMKIEVLALDVSVNGSPRRLREVVAEPNVFIIVRYKLHVLSFSFIHLSTFDRLASLSAYMKASSL